MKKTEQILKLLRAGQTPKQIKALVQCSASTITALRKRLGLPPFKRGAVAGYVRAATTIKLKRINHMRACGLTWQEVGQQMNCTRQAVHSLVKYHKSLDKKKLKCKVGA